MSLSKKVFHYFQPRVLLPTQVTLSFEILLSSLGEPSCHHSDVEHPILHCRSFPAGKRGTRYTALMRIFVELCVAIALIATANALAPFLIGAQPWTPWFGIAALFALAAGVFRNTRNRLRRRPRPRRRKTHPASDTVSHLHSHIVTQRRFRRIFISETHSAHDR